MCFFSPKEKMDDWEIKEFTLSLMYLVEWKELQHQTISVQRP